MSDIPNGRSGPSDEEILSATPRGSGGKEAQVGAFVLLGLISFILVLFWMTDPATLRGRYMLVTQVENAGGVRSGDPIQMQGVNIGRVHDFEMLGDSRVVITMEIEGQWGIPIGSETVMGESGLFGGRTLEIVRGPGPGVYAEGDTLVGEGASASGLLGSVDVLSAQAGSVLASLNTMLDDTTVSAVQGSAQELQRLLAQLSGVTREQRAALEDLTASLTSAANGVEAASAAGPDIASAVARADSAMAMLQTTSVSLDAATTSLNTILARMERGEGTLGRLSTDESLFVNMNTAAESLTALLADL
ncbi:MAG: MlaD family protein, partial [Gemmatimonadota bacterium]|nr:MlaD family protein [Gemmatimonadota bacterium]